MDNPDRPAVPDRPSEPNRQDAERRRIVRAESIGLIVIALAILLYTLLRYGAQLNWSAR